MWSWGWLAATLSLGEVVAESRAPFENLYRDAYERRLQEHGPGHPRTTASLVRLAALLRSHGRVGVAEPLLRKALDDAVPSASAEVMVELAATLVALGRRSEAEGFYQRYLERTEPGGSSARALLKLAELRTAGGDSAGAMQAYRTALQHLAKVDSPSVDDRRVRAAALNELGTLLEADGALLAAEKAYRESAQAHARTFGDRHPATATVRANLASILALRGEASDAANLLEQSLEVIRTAFGPHHQDVAGLHNRLGEVYEVLDRLDDAEAQYLSALAAWHEPSPSRGLVLADLGRLAGVRDDAGTAETYLAEAVRHLRTAGAAFTVELAEAMNSYGSVLRDSGRLSEAEPLLSEALAVRQRELGESHPDVALSLVGLGGVFHLGGDLARAGSLYSRALGIQERTLGPDHPEVGETLYNLAYVWQSQGDTSGAREALERAAGILSAAYGPNDPFVLEIVTTLRGLR